MAQWQCTYEHSSRRVPSPTPRDPSKQVSCVCDPPLPLCEDKTSKKGPVHVHPGQVGHHPWKRHQRSHVLRRLDPLLPTGTLSHLGQRRRLRDWGPSVKCRKGFELPHRGSTRHFLSIHFMPRPCQPCSGSPEITSPLPGGDGQGSMAGL